MFNSPSRQELYKENKKLRVLLNNIWQMLDECKLDFSNGCVAPNGVDEGDVLGWRFYRELEEESKKVLNPAYGKRKKELEAKDKPKQPEDDIPF